MLSSVAIIFLLFAGVFSSEIENCRYDAAEDCDPPSRYFKNFPDSKEDLDTKCRHGIRFMRCTYNKLKKCEDEEEESMQLMRHMLFYIETELCNEDSHVYSIFSRNLGCLNHTLPTLRYICQRESLQQKKEKMMSILGTHELGDTDDEGKLEKCFHTLYLLACNSVTLEEACGEPVGEVYADVALNLHPIFQLCPVEIQTKLPYAIRALKAVEEAKEEVENAIKRRKK